MSSLPKPYPGIAKQAHPARIIIPPRWAPRQLARPVNPLGVRHHDGHPAIGIAQTGSGKTAAFVLPILQHLTNDGFRPSPKGVLALILAPTRELALQIGNSVKTYAKHLQIRHTVILGGVNHRGTDRPH